MVVQIWSWGIRTAPPLCFESIVPAAKAMVNPANLVDFLFAESAEFAAI
jgi:hypothetical protein